MRRRAIVVNLWFIKHSNGLFHYGLDYAEALGAQVQAIWVRDEAMAHTVRQRLPRVAVRTLSFPALMASLCGAAVRGTPLFTPSSHPVPLLRRQVVVVHDSYPFIGTAGRVKLALFRTAIATSGTVAGYINHADSGAFLRRIGLPAGRTRFLPNRLSAAASGPRRPGRGRAGEAHRVGLFGSDSPKKNYDALFSAAMADPRARAGAYRWRIFGHANDYTAHLLRTYPTLAIEIVESDRCTMETFVDDLDAAVSVAEGEGFARPVALALMRGIPTLLLDGPVFREFYAGSAAMFATPQTLVSALPSVATGAPAVHFARETELRAAFDDAVDWLRGGAIA